MMNIQIGGACIMNESFQYLLNQGVAILVCVYFMWSNHTVMKDMQGAIEKLTEAINTMEATHKKNNNEKI